MLIFWFILSIILKYERSLYHISNPQYLLPLFVPIALLVNVHCIPIGRAAHAEQGTAAGSPCPFREQIGNTIYYSTFPRTHLKFSKPVC